MKDEKIKSQFDQIISALSLIMDQSLVNIL